MAKGNNEARGSHGVTRPIEASGVTTADALARRVLAFAEELGRMAGTLEAKADGWMDRSTLTKQIAKVRDGAAELLERIAGDATEASRTIPNAAAAPGSTKGRSGGVVDAPGKKHRRPLPADPGVNQAASQATKMRAARTMVKTTRRRGRG